MENLDTKQFDEYEDEKIQGNTAEDFLEGDTESILNDTTKELDKAEREVRQETRFRTKDMFDKKNAESKEDTPNKDRIYKNIKVEKTKPLK